MKKNKLCITRPMLVLVRGLPGSGKSTVAKQIITKPVDEFQKWKHFEADMYHIDWGTGEYIFNPARIKHAHDWCFNSTVTALKHGYCVVVSNTFVKLWEMERYLNAWETVMVLKCTGDYGSVHDVPDETMERMRNTWEDYDGEFPLT